jgi:hypothetical protein
MGVKASSWRGLSHNPLYWLLMILVLGGEVWLAVPRIFLGKRR